MKTASKMIAVTSILLASCAGQQTNNTYFNGLNQQPSNFEQAQYNRFENRQNDWITCVLQKRANNEKIFDC